MDTNAGRSLPSEAEDSRIADPRLLALDHMQAALQQLDRDVEVSPFVGLHLQLAIDRLTASASGNPQAD